MTPPASDAKFSLARAALLSLLAGLVAALFWCGVELRSLRGQVAVLETERDLAITAHQLAVNQLAERTLLAEGMINDLQRRLREPPDPAQAKVIPLTATDGSLASGVLLWDASHRAGSFVAQRLRAPAEGEAYSLWLTNPKTRLRIHLGAVQPLANGTAITVFDPAPKGAASDDLSEFTISVEARRTTLSVSDGGRVVLASQ